MRGPHGIASLTLSFGESLEQARETPVTSLGVYVLPNLWRLDHLLGTLRCRLGRAATTPSPKVEAAPWLDRTQPT